MLVASHCILTSDGQGPSHGTLIMGRYLDQSELVHLSLSLGVPLFLSLIDASKMSEDFALAMQHLSVDEPFYVQPLNDTSIAGYALLSDVEGEPLLIVKAVDERTGLAYGAAAMTYFIAFLFIVASIILIVLFVLLERTVISRLATLSDTVTKIRATNDNHKRVLIKWNDEISSLGQNINGMLDEINQHTYTLEQTVVERTRDLSENRKQLESIL